jgi:hypothetical protein
MNSFDASILSWFNSFAQASQHFDLLLWEISENHLLKGGVPLSFLCFAQYPPFAKQANFRNNNDFWTSTSWLYHVKIIVEKISELQ